ncbi:MAG: hypothetical protein JNM76_10625 [Betaproteobacteria bacterium]|nr:hypothetical protein [Betaproteobacteria bacterium]
MKVERAVRAFAAALGGILLAGCGSLVGEKRHSPAEIAVYQPADFVAPIASETERTRLHAELRARIARAVAQSGEDPGDALWAVKFLNQAEDAGRVLTLAALPRLGEMSAPAQRAVLDAAHALYAAEAAPLTLPLLQAIVTPREFAMAAYVVLRADPRPETRANIRSVLETRFPAWREEPRLIALHHALTRDANAERAARPPLEDLLAAPFRPGWPVVFSLQRTGREHFGLALVRAGDGRFVRAADGGVFHVPQLARALSNMPGTITNGNTPQGLFSIVGAGTATSTLIGPTPYLHSKVPVEATVTEFEHADSAAEWSEAVYESFLPPSWRPYAPVKEAWLAGRAGRDEMLLHGTTIDPALYQGRPWYPGTPSAGCLVAMEYWSPADGRLMQSDQLSLAKAFTAGGLDRGYLMVVELDDQRRPVSLEEVLPALLAAEARIAGR